ncbi:MAG TPA: hypothetical protein VLT86_03210 [Vicinamibacterales bacterium]|nr:hypothetical protein [Vicinamibacterales bacterium]
MAAALATSLGAAPQAPDPAQLIAAARQALGGEARLNAVRTFRAVGAIESADGPGPSRTYGSFEIDCELPDRFVETESRRYVDAGLGAGVDVGSTTPTGSGAVGYSSSRPASTIGFNGQSAIYEPSRYYAGWSSPAWTWGPSDPPPVADAKLKEAMSNARRDFVRWTMGLFAATFNVPQPFGQLQVDSSTHLPVRLGTLEYLDYRDVNGLKVPFRLRQLKPGRTDWIVHDFKFNVDIPAKTFQPTKASGK